MGSLGRRSTTRPHSLHHAVGEVHAWPLVPENAACGGPGFAVRPQRSPDLGRDLAPGACLETKQVCRQSSHRFGGAPPMFEANGETHDHRAQPGCRRSAVSWNKPC